MSQLDRVVVSLDRSELGPVKSGGGLAATSVTTQGDAAATAAEAADARGDARTTVRPTACVRGWAVDFAPTDRAIVTESRTRFARRGAVLGLSALGAAGLMRSAAGQVAFGHEDILTFFSDIRVLQVSAQISLWQRDRWHTAESGSPYTVPEVEPGGLLPPGFSREAQLRAEAHAAKLLERNDARWFADRRGFGTPVRVHRAADRALLGDDARGGLVIDLLLFVRDATPEVQSSMAPNLRLVAMTDLRRYLRRGVSVAPRGVTWAPSLVVEAMAAGEAAERVLARLETVLTAAVSRAFPPRR